LVSENGSRFLGPYSGTLRGQKAPPILGKMGAPILATSLFSTLESWPKFEQVTKKVPTPRTLQLLDFDEKSTFDLSALFALIKRGCFHFRK
jgi:hypothetical protein